MSRLAKHSIAVFACLIALGCIASLSPQFADEAGSSETKESLSARVAALEKTVAQLQRQIQNDKLAFSLSGHWLETSREIAGMQEHQTEEIAWRLATDASSDRYILGPEVTAFRFGKFNVDTSHDPIWIDFELGPPGKSRIRRGIMRASFAECEIALPGNSVGDGISRDASRPTSFESTAENGYEIYRLIRERYKQTGVWR